LGFVDGQTHIEKIITSNKKTLNQETSKVILEKIAKNKGNLPSVNNLNSKIE
jgi:hypothetical protein